MFILDTDTPQQYGIAVVTPTFMGTGGLGGEFLAPEPGDPGDPGEPGCSAAEEGGLDRLVLVDPEKESFKLGL